MAVASGATPQATNRTSRSLRIPIATLPMVGLEVGGATLPPHPMVVLGGSWLLLVLIEIILGSGPA